MKYTEISACRVCGNKNLVKVLDLGIQSLTGFFPATKEQKITAGPLSLVKCHGGNDVCHLLQLQHTYQLNELYGENYGYRSGLNKSMVRHLELKVADILRRISLSPNDLVIDIGSNDGTTLGFYPQGDWDLVGIDPTGNNFLQYYKDHVKLIPDFFSADKLTQIMGHRKVKVVTSFSMFYDLENPVQFASEIASVLSVDGIWVLEQSYMPTMLRMNSYDTICHEHLEYYGLTQIKWIVEKAGLKILDVDFNNINGGSFSIVVAQKDSALAANNDKIQKILQDESVFKELSPYQEFSDRVEKEKNNLIYFLKKIKSEGKSICGIGASTKGNVILQYCNITEELIPEIGEVNENKYGKYTPGTLIKIISEGEALSKNPDYVLILPWHFHEFFEKSDKFKNTKLIYPLSINSEQK
ncbi:MAG: class I SAM-dependent methyltransferase [Bdellovibrio sp.]